MGSDVRLLIVGNPDAVHVGAHLLESAVALGLAVEFHDTTAAFGGPAWRRRVSWWMGGHRPARLGPFSRQVVGAAQRFRPTHVVATGLAPLDAAALAALGALGVTRINFLTDDPWNPMHRAPWFLEALPHYDRVYSPRHANLDDIAALRGPVAEYLPFAYAPGIHYPDPPANDAERGQYTADVMFVGGADRDRLPIVAELIQAGLDVALYGGYWDRRPETRKQARGFLDAHSLRKATAGARVCLGLVRRANRDGHSMRTFEGPAMGGCMLVEDTPDHRDLFGPEGAAVAYFRETGESLAAVRRLLKDAHARRVLASAAHQVVTSGRHTYTDRLAAMLQVGAAVALAAG